MRKTSIVSSSTSETFKLDGSGAYIFGVQLVNNDLTTLAIPATAEATVFVDIYGGFATR